MNVATNEIAAVPRISTRSTPMLPFTPAKGAGVWLEDAHGPTSARSLRRPRGRRARLRPSAAVRRASRAQARDLVFQTQRVPLEVRDEAADALAKFAPPGVGRVFFVNSGAEANENALQVAFKVTGRAEDRRDRAKLPRPHRGRGRRDLGRHRTGTDSRARRSTCSSCRATDIAALEPPSTRRHRGRDRRARAGHSRARSISRRSSCARCAPRATGRRASDLRRGADAASGRIGEPFGRNLYRVGRTSSRPRRRSAAASRAARCCCRTQIAADLKPGALGTTFGGGPVACAAIKAVIDGDRDEKLLARVREVERGDPRDLRRRARSIGVQGAGFLLGLRTAEGRQAGPRRSCSQRDILTGTSADPHVLRLLPPLILNAEHVQRLATALED